MAKNDNIIDFLGDVADAIREKKGTTDPIAAQDFADEIKSIETDGMRYFDVRGVALDEWVIAASWWKLYSDGDWLIGPGLAVDAFDGIIAAVAIDNRKMTINGVLTFVTDAIKNAFGVDFETAFPEITEEEFYDLTWEAPEQQLPI